MKKLSVSFLVLTCFFSSPNCGVLFASTPGNDIGAGGFFQQGSVPRGIAKAPETKIAKLVPQLKRARLLKRTLFIVDFQEVILFSLMAFCFTFLFFFIFVSRKPSLLFLRAPPPAAR